MIAGLILAGGRGTRLGGVDKAFLRLGGRKLVEIALARLTPQVARMAISANGDAGRFAEYGLPVLADRLEGRGPLAGVAAGLEWAAGIGAAGLVTVPVDTPFVPEDFVARLGAGPAVAAHGGRTHYLAACWPVGFGPALEGFLAAPGAYRVRDALALAGAREVVFGEADDPFLNINRAEDLAAAERAASRLT